MVVTEIDRRAYLRDALAHPEVRRLAETAREIRTSHAGGHVMWREWGGGRPVVLLHGGFGSWLHWVRNISSLAKHHRVLAADLPGLGESDAVRDPAPGAFDVAAPLVEGLRSLLAPSGRFSLVCFSLGCVIGGDVAHAMQDRLDRAILVGPSGLGDLWRDVTGELRRRHPAMTPQEWRETIRHNLLLSMIADPASIDDMALDIQSDLLRQKRQLIGMPISLSDALMTRLPIIAPRCTFVWGERDGYASPNVAAVAERIRERFTVTDTRVLAGVGHWAAYEASPTLNDLFARLLPH